MQALHSLSAATGVYCPLAQPLLGLLQWPGLRKKLPGKAGAAPMGTPTAPTLKAGDALLASSIWQQSLVEQVAPCSTCCCCAIAGSDSKISPRLAALRRLQGRLSWSCCLQLPQLPCTDIQPMQQVAQQPSVWCQRAPVHPMPHAAF